MDQSHDQQMPAASVAASSRLLAPHYKLREPGLFFNRHIEPGLQGFTARSRCFSRRRIWAQKKLRYHVQRYSTYSFREAITGPRIHQAGRTQLVPRSAGERWYADSRAYTSQGQIQIKRRLLQSNKKPSICTCSPLRKVSPIPNSDMIVFLYLLLIISPRITSQIRD